MAVFELINESANIIFLSLVSLAGQRTRNRVCTEQLPATAKEAAGHQARIRGTVEPTHEGRHAEPARDCRFEAGPQDLSSRDFGTEEQRAVQDVTNR